MTTTQTASGNPPPPRCAAPARVLHTTNLCHAHIAIEFVLPEFPASHPGQFLQVLCREHEHPDPIAQHWPPDGFPSIHDPDFTRLEPYLRRPFSIADRFDADDGTHLLLISRSVGVATRWLDRVRPGDGLDITGPLGRGFRIPPSSAPLVLVGGGVGIPPLLYLTRWLHERRYTAVTCIFGATTRDLLPLRLRAQPNREGAPSPCVELPGQAPFASVITTDDGTLGLPGRVSDALLHQPLGRDSLVLACGPEPMLRAVADLTRTFGCACQLCIERNMGCGVGTCQSCVVRLRDLGRPEGWRWALTCTEGPVFDRDDLLDYAPSPGT